MDAVLTDDALVAAEAVAEVAADDLGRRLVLAHGPEPVPAAFGAGAYLCSPEPGSPAPWDRPLVVRVTDPAGAAREAAWHGFLARGGLAVPEVCGVAESGGRGALVLTQGPSLSVMESLGLHPMAIPQLLRAMAEAHARLHALPVTGAPDPVDPEPLDALDARLREAGLADEFAVERRWLDAHARPPERQVICHGDLQPAAMRLEGDDPSTAMLVNWMGARVGEPEYDLALTLLMFWSVPYLAEGMGQRKMLKTVRDVIIDGYRAAYEAADGTVPPSQDRLDYWGAFHALRWSVALRVAELRDGPADEWDPVALVHHLGPYRKDLTRRFSRLTRS